MTPPRGRAPSGPSEATRALACRLVETPVGPLLVVASGLGIRAIAFATGGAAADPSELREHLGHTLKAPVLEEDAPLLARAERAIGQYFSGRAHGFTLPLDVDGTSFQRLVWRALAALPLGATVTYGELAERVGRPGAVRAVANACARNPVPIIIPCHRVVGANGELRGYLGGVDAKRRLLALERRFAPDLPLLALVADAGDAGDPAPCSRSSPAAPVAATDVADEDEWLTRILDHEAVDAWPSRAEEALTRGHERAADELLEAWVAELAELVAPPEEDVVTPPDEDLVTPHIAAWATPPSVATQPSWPPVASLRAFVFAAARLGSPLLARAAGAFGRDPRLPVEHREALASAYVATMNGETPAPRHIREIAVDLWLELDPERHEAALRGLLAGRIE